MEPFTLIAIGVGALVTFVASFLKRVEWSTERKVSLVTALSVVGGVAVALAQGDLSNIQNVSEAMGVVFTSSQLVYQFIARRLSFNEKLELFGSDVESVNHSDFEPDAAVSEVDVPESY